MYSLDAEEACVTLPESTKLDIEFISCSGIANIENIHIFPNLKELQCLEEYYEDKFIEWLYPIEPKFLIHNQKLKYLHCYFYNFEGLTELKNIKRYTYTSMFGDGPYDAVVKYDQIFVYSFLKRNSYKEINDYIYNNIFKQKTEKVILESTIINPSIIYELNYPYYSHGNTESYKGLEKITNILSCNFSNISLSNITTDDAPYFQNIVNWRQGGGRFNEGMEEFVNVFPNIEILHFDYGYYNYNLFSNLEIYVPNLKVLSIFDDCTVIFNDEITHDYCDDNTNEDHVCTYTDFKDDIINSICNLDKLEIFIYEYCVNDSNTHTHSIKRFLRILENLDNLKYFYIVNFRECQERKIIPLDEINDKCKEKGIKFFHN